MQSCKMGQELCKQHFQLLHCCIKHFSRKPQEISWLASGVQAVEGLQKTCKQKINPFIFLYCTSNSIFASFHSFCFTTSHLNNGTQHLTIYITFADFTLSLKQTYQYNYTNTIFSIYRFSQGRNSISMGSILPYFQCDIFITKFLYFQMRKCQYKYQCENIRHIKDKCW